MAKKLIVLFAVLAAVSSTFAQEESQSVRFGVRAGLNLGKIEFDESGFYSDEYGSRKRTTDWILGSGNSIGFHVGTVVDIRVYEFLYLQPGLMFSLKGGDSKSEYERHYYNNNISNDYFESETSTLTAYYIDIPFMLSLKGRLNDNLALRAHVGPYIGFGLFGKYEIEYKETPDNGDNGKEKIKNVFSPSNEEKEKTEFEGLNRFNLGIGFGVGIEIIDFYLGVNYNYGLTNAYKKNDLMKLYERTLGITLGYNF